jgi:hypothetical protein
MMDKRVQNLKPFKPGQSGNPGGKTREQRQAEVAAAELAAKLQYRMLEAMAGLFNEHPEKEKIVEHIKADPLRLIMDAMDRGFGKPGQNIDLTSSDGTMSPAAEREAVIAALRAKHAKPDAEG